ncbi:MAG: SDR family NAD(P)-dependent oxidoreductase [Hyphomicrobiales bacterium]|nr:SDR family NAD(P)-dependent oxidoreductase [Hyphomicrobiales bacterium]MCP5372103.1 SDR family NAD(P)-dependent oxidoreductase [Hyphomicrobiales bacterium]
MEFENRHVVVTGGTGALGTAVARRLLAAGATCHIPNLDPGELDRFPLAGHDRVRVVSGVDLTDEAGVAGFYGGLPGLWASIHIAGGFAMAPLAETSKADFLAQMNMNALTCFLCCRAAVANMTAGGGAGEGGNGSEGGGRLVNVAARPALEPRQGAGMAAYTASKAAVAALTQCLGEELAGAGIWVNAVAPSILDTPANRAAMPGADHAAWPSVDAVAATIVHLASPDNGAARSAVVPVYGRV